MWISHRKEVRKLISLQWLIHIINSVDKTKYATKTLLHYDFFSVSKANLFTLANSHYQLLTSSLRLVFSFSFTEIEEVKRALDELHRLPSTDL